MYCLEIDECAKARTPLGYDWRAGRDSPQGVKAGCGRRPEGAHPEPPDPQQRCSTITRDYGNEPDQAEMSPVSKPSRNTRAAGAPMIWAIAATFILRISSPIAMVKCCGRSLLVW